MHIVLGVCVGTLAPRPLNNLLLTPLNNLFTYLCRRVPTAKEDDPRPVRLRRSQCLILTAGHTSQKGMAHT